MTDLHMRVISLTDYRASRALREKADQMQPTKDQNERPRYLTANVPDLIPLSADLCIILMKRMTQNGLYVSIYSIVSAPLYQRHDMEYLKRFNRFRWNGLVFQCEEHPNHLQRFAKGNPDRVLQRAIRLLSDEERRKIADTWLAGVTTGGVKYVKDPFKDLTKANTR
jgi:hypothetical protein